MSRFERIAASCGVLVMVYACICMLGWHLKIQSLASLAPSYIPMAPSTAMGFFLLGMSISWTAWKPRSTAVQTFSRVGSALVCAFSLAVIVSFLAGMDLNLERIFVQNPESFGRVLKGRMSPITALSFLLLSAGILEIRMRWRRPVPPGIFVLAAVFINCVILLGYLYGTPLLYGGTIIPVALSTALVFLTMGIGSIALLGPNGFPLNYFLGRSARALLVRIFLPLAITGNLLGSLVTYRLSLYGQVNAALASALATLVFCILLALFIAHCAKKIESELGRMESERKSMEAQLIRAQRMESLGTLAGGIAHDLNNVMAPIMMATQILRRRPLDDSGRQILDVVESGAKRGSDMIKQILTFARGVEGKRMLLQPGHIIREILQVVRETFPRIIELKSNIDKDLWLIQADPTQLHQILLNLAVNARDAMPQAGTLLIKAENVRLTAAEVAKHSGAKEGAYVQITVSDTGTGIPPEILNRIFDPFFTTKGIEKGTGLGLSTVSSLVKVHSGFLTVQSEVGSGTEFRIFLPADEFSEDEKQKEKKELPMGRGELVLIIDDEVAIRSLAKTTLHSYGYEAITAEDGSEGVAIAAQRMNDLKVVLCDLDMPIMDGRSTIRALCKLKANLAVIVMSGSESNQMSASEEPNVRALLRKPYTAEQLLETLAGVLDRKF